MGPTILWIAKQKTIFKYSYQTTPKLFKQSIWILITQIQIFVPKYCYPNTPLVNLTFEVTLVY